MQEIQLCHHRNKLHFNRKVILIVFLFYFFNLFLENILKNEFHFMTLVVASKESRERLCILLFLFFLTQGTHQGSSPKN